MQKEDFQNDVVFTFRNEIFRFKVDREIGNNYIAGYDFGYMATISRMTKEKIYWYFYRFGKCCSGSIDIKQCAVYELPQQTETKK